MYLDNAAPGVHLRHILGAAAVTSGMQLKETGIAGVLSDRQARAAAANWGLTPTAATVVVLVDGLGLELLHERKGHAPTLRAWLAQTERNFSFGVQALTCVPSTTAAALSTLGTGALPGLTGMVGYSVLRPGVDRLALGNRQPVAVDDLCLITWDDPVLDARTWQNVPTIFQRLELPDGSACSAPAPTAVTIGPARFAGSGLTEASLRGAVHYGADRMEDRPALAAAALAKRARLVYLYVGELDHAGHKYGWHSAQWLVQLERLDATMAALLRKLPPQTRIVLTADHGMVDTDAAHRIYIPEHRELARDVVAIAGEPRFTHLYVSHSDPELAQEVAARWQEFLGERAAWVGTRAQAAQVFGAVSERAYGVVGDVLVAMNGQWVVVDPRVHSESAIAMPGVHGSLTSAEMRIPVLVTQT